MSQPATNPNASATLGSAAADRSSTPAGDARAGLLDRILVGSGQSRQVSWLDAFLAEDDWLRALAMWLGHTGGAAGVPRRGADAVGIRLDQDIAEIDAMLTRQTNAILHHPEFQALESGWRGLGYLVSQVREDAEGLVKVRVLDVSWKELARDAERAIEFDQTVFWRKVYEEEFGMPGGQPFGVLIGDYQVRHRPGPDHPVDDIGLLRSIGQTAASAFVPFITGADPTLLGLSHFGQFDRRIDLQRLFSQPEYVNWNAMRHEPDMRFVGVALPRVLMRLPHKATTAGVTLACCATCGASYGRPGHGPGACAACGAQVDPDQPAGHTRRSLGFRYAEDVASRDGSGYLWGNAAYAFGSVLIRSFIDSRWLADIRGFDRNLIGGGVVPDLPSDSYGYDQPGVAPKMGAEVAIDDVQEDELGRRGLIPLSHCHDTDWHVFYSNNSLHQPQAYDDPSATLNARVSSMMQYTLCASRFAHYIKVQTRERVGSRVEAAELQNRMIDWINSYVTQDSVASAEVKARYPLREAEVEILETPGQPGTYQCVMRLWPHYQLDEVSMSVKMITPVSAGRRG